MGRASLLNNMGRAVLISSVIDSQLVYIVSATQLPPEVIKQIDRRRRAFLWAGTAETLAGKCLVAWDQVCTTKDLGGLGIKDLGTQNICLLLSLLHRLHNAQHSAWAAWLRGRADIANMNANDLGSHWELLRSILPLYQAITSVQLGDGRTTYFWSDVWLHDDPLSHLYLRLFTHCTKADITVRQCLDDGLQRHLRNRLSSQAEQELQQLQAMLQLVYFSDQPDTRLSDFCKGSVKLDTSSIYRVLKARGQPVSPAADFIWKNPAPPRVQLFLWLLSGGRIQCWANLHKKKMVDSPACTICGGTEETAAHIILGCAPARQFWASVGVPLIAQNPLVVDLLSLQRPSAVLAVHHNGFVALCCWQLWKHRNAWVFRGESTSESPSLVLIVDDIPKD